MRRVSHLTSKVSQATHFAVQARHQTVLERVYKPLFPYGQRLTTRRVPYNPSTIHLGELGVKA